VSAPCSSFPLNNESNFTVVSNQSVLSLTTIDFAHSWKNIILAGQRDHKFLLCHGHGCFTILFSYLKNFSRKFFSSFSHLTTSLTTSNYFSRLVDIAH
jgi:hypothetical protein